MWVATPDDCNEIGDVERLRGMAGQLAGRAGYLFGIVLPPEPVWPGAVVLAIVLPWTASAIALLGLPHLRPAAGRAGRPCRCARVDFSA
jgi:hypothetical protein